METSKISIPFFSRIKTKIAILLLDLLLLQPLQEPCLSNVHTHTRVYVRVHIGLKIILRHQTCSSSMRIFAAQAADGKIYRRTLESSISRDESTINPRCFSLSFKATIPQKRQDIRQQPANGISILRWQE